MSSHDDLDILVRHIETCIGKEVSPRPAGWVDEIDAALLDAIFSIRARYGGPNTGVRAVVRRWQAHPGRVVDDLRVLAEQNPAQLAALLANASKIHGRYKAEVAIDAAAALARTGLVHSNQFIGSADQKRAYLSVCGCGPVTWSYFGMLLGRPDVKADTWVMRFVREALPGATPAEARILVNKAAQRLGLDATALDNTIWKLQRGRRRKLD